MLGRFFKANSNNIDSRNRNIGEKFYLKPHAEKDFFSWVNQWSIMVKMPSDHWIFRRAIYFTGIDYKQTHC